MTRASLSECTLRVALRICAEKLTTDSGVAAVALAIIMHRDLVVCAVI